MSIKELVLAPVASPEAVEVEVAQDDDRHAAAELQDRHVVVALQDHHVDRHVVAELPDHHAGVALPDHLCEAPDEQAQEAVQ